MKYSFVVPIYNDGVLAEAFCAEMKRVFSAHLGREDIEAELEVVFVDDGSENDSADRVRATCDRFRFAKLIRLSRNFGQHIAISCGYEHARGELIGYLNVDQEDPPDQILVLLEALRENPGWDIVGGLYAERNVPFFQKLTSHWFNVVLNALTGYSMPPNASTLRIMRRRFVDAYNGLQERSRFIPGLEMWLGFEYHHVPVRHQARKTGKSSYNFERRLRMATESIISFSDFPLRAAVKCGFAVVAFGLLITAAMIVDKLFFRAFLPGYVSTIAIAVLLAGVQITVTGIASLYIGRILAEVQGRPLYLVRELHGDLPRDRLGYTPSHPRRVDGS